MLREEGPEHDKGVTLGGYINNEWRGQGGGTSKQIAQQKAAEAALKTVDSEKEPETKPQTD